MTIVGRSRWHPHPTQIAPGNVALRGFVEVHEMRRAFAISAASLLGLLGVALIYLRNSISFYCYPIGAPDQIKHSTNPRALGLVGSALVSVAVLILSRVIRR